MLVARKVWLKDLMDLVTPPNQASRVHILGTITELQNDSEFILDDGTDTVLVQLPENRTRNLGVGNMVDVVGEFQIQNKEKFVVGEVLREITDPNWELLRDLEIIQARLKPTSKTKVAKEEIVVEESKVEKYPTTDLVKIKDIQQENQWVSLQVKVVQLWEANSEAISQVGLVGDATGTIKFVAWKKSNLPLMEENKCYELKNVVTDAWQGRYQINLNKNSSINPITEDIQVGTAQTRVTGAIVAIQGGSGLIKRCPTCNRRLVKGVCGEHGKVEGAYDLRVKAVLDNGETAQDILLNQEITTELTNITLEKAKEMATETLDPNIVLDKIKKVLLGRYFTVKGSRVGRYILVTEIDQMKKPTIKTTDLIKEVEALKC